MCDYCACRDHQLIRRLGDDHAHLLAWCVRVEAALRADDDDAARAGVEHLLAVLDPHLDLEERALLPALEGDEAFASTVAAITADHDHARTARPVPDPADPGWAVAVPAFVSDLRAHIHLEEYDVFPAAAQLLTPALWSTAEDAAA